MFVNLNFYFFAIMKQKWENNLFNTKFKMIETIAGCNGSDGNQYSEEDIRAKVMDKNILLMQIHFLLSLYHNRFEMWFLAFKIVDNRCV